MKKRVLSLFLAAAMVLTLTAPAFAAAMYDPTATPIQELLPTNLRQPAYPTTVKQAGGDPEKGQESVLQEIVDLTGSLTAGKTSDKEKMKAIYEWVAQNVTYDLNGGGSAFDTYTLRRAYCAGYADLCWLMGTIAGITVANIGGMANESSPGLHDWNAALIDGKWLFFDATWKLWDMDANYHHWFMAYCYDDIYKWDIRAGDSENPDLLIFTLRPGYEDQCPANLVIPEQVTEVTNFYDCANLESVTFSGSVTQVSGFGRCANLKNVAFNKGLAQIGNSAFAECTALKSVTIPDSVTTIDHLAFSRSGLESVTIPDSVTTLTGSFSGCADLKRVTIGKGVTSIGHSTFMDCTSLTDVTIPDSVKTIEEQAFYGCTSLENVTIPEGVTAIEDMAFFGCTSLKRADLPDSVTSLGNGVFTGCPNLQSVSIPAGSTSIGVGAFQCRDDLISFVIPDHITEISDRAFSDCPNLESVTIPDSVTIIKYAAFRTCPSLKSITIPSSVAIIEHEAFSGCTGLTSMTFPEGVVSIGNWATPYTLESITLPVSVTSIGGHVLSGSLRDVYYAGTEEQWKAISFGDSTIPDKITIHYNSTGPQQPAQPETPVAYASTQNVLVDGKPVEFYAYALKDANGNDTNYVKLRDVAQILNGSAAQFEVGWDGAISITTKTPYTPNGSEMLQNFTGNQSYTVNSAPVKVNGVEAGLEAITLTDADGGGFTYFKLRDLGRTLGFNVSWSGEKGVYIETDRLYAAEN